MDSIDRMILIELLQNCRISYEELGHKVGLSASSVWRRVTELEEAGVIDRYLLALTRQVVAPRVIHALLSLDGSVSDNEILESIQRDEKSVACSAVMNRFCIASYEVLSEDEEESLLQRVRSIPGVAAMSTYSHQEPLQAPDGDNEMDFSESEKELLRLLFKNPRISINEMGEITGKTYRRVKKTLDGIVASGKVRFGVEWNPNIRGNEMFLFWMTLNPDFDIEEIREWLQERYPENYWWAYLTSTEDAMFANFAFEQVSQALMVKDEVAQHPNIKHAEVFFVKSHFRRPRIAERMLQENLNL